MAREPVRLRAHLGEFLIRVADAFGLEKPHIIAPDIGTSAALFAAAAHPGRLRSLVVGSGGTVVSPDQDVLSTDPRRIVAGVLRGIERDALPDSVREDYLSS